MDLIKVDLDKCVKCGICIEVCPSCILEMGDAGPVCKWERGCMACGHCVAVCPTAALDNNRCLLEKQAEISMPVLHPEKAYNFLRMRRSVRNFLPRTVEKEKIIKLLDAARYAPTAGNSQGLYYIVLSDPEAIKMVADLTAEWMQLEIDADSPHSRYFANILRTYRERNIDIIARQTPHLIIACARKLNLTGLSNCDQAWAYAGLYAPTLGLGTTIAGFIQTCGHAGYQPMLDFLGVSKKHQIVGALMVGYQKYKYYRLVERQHLKVEFR